jgi:phosphinothricin acetyltransferase
VATSTATFQERPVDLGGMRAMLLMPDPRHASFALRAAGALVGYALLGPYKARCAYRDAAEVAVYLAPGATGRGWGRAALEALERHARAHGLHVLLAGVCTENEASIKLFSRAGYEQVARFRQVGFKFGRRLDVAYLQKLLG